MGKEMPLVTREYTINLKKRLRNSGNKHRAPRAIKRIREFAEKAMGTKTVRIDTAVNQKIWSKGVKKIPYKVRVRIERRKNDEEEEDNEEEYVSVVSLVDVEKGGFHGLVTEIVTETAA